MLHAFSFAVAISLLVAPMGPSREPAEGKKQAAPKSEKYEELKQRLQNDDWVEVYSPLTRRDVRILAHNDNGKQTKYLKGKLRFTLLVVAAPIDIEAKESKKIEFDILSKDNKTHAFDTSDGRREFEFTQDRPQVIFQGNGNNRLPREYTISALPDHKRKVIFLQEKIDLVDGDNVICSWFTSDYDLAVFAKRTKDK